MDSKSRVRADKPHAETKPRFGTDITLRKAGFAILSRPRHGPNLWIRNGAEYIESAALDLVRRGVIKEESDEQEAKSTGKS